MTKLYSISIFIFLLFAGTASFAQEDCEDGIDNDGDGLVDLNDPDCDCPGIGGTVTPSSLIPNPSFEDNTCCPTGPSQLACADGWVQASAATSDYWNFCDFDSYPGFNPVGTPLPGDGSGTGWAGFISQPGYSEYIGSCLTSPMLAGTPYVLNMWIALADGNPDLELTIYGTDDCADLPWGPGYTCPTGIDGWVELDDVTVTTTTDGSWSEVTLNFTPTVDIEAIAIGGPCVEAGIPAGSSYNYYWVDELTIIDSVAFAGGNIEETGDWCLGDLTLTSTIDTVGWTCLWYLDGVALPGETAETIDVMTYGAGTYTIVYTVDAECDESSYTIVIPDAPMADFTFADQCEDAGAVDFTDASTITAGAITDWDWDFDDGGATSTDQNPSYTFSGPGTYNVSLTVTSATGCTNTIVFAITIYPDPVADFEFSIDGISSTTGLIGGCLGKTVDFGNNSTIGVPDNITITNWDFDDGNFSGLSDPSHTYAADGTYNVELAIESNNGCQDTLVVPVTIHPNPVADFTVAPVCENVDAVFTDISVVGGGAITGWEWDFNDGSPINIFAGPLNHTYGNGTYNPTLVVTTDMGCTDTVSVAVDIYAVPVASFTTSDVCNGETSVFADNSTIAAGAIATWSYDFDDASPLDPAASTTHLYTAGGVYNVTLTVVSDNGCVDDTTIAHSVTDGPTADFSTNNVCHGVEAGFTDLSFAPSGAITYWEWDFGDASGTDLTPGSANHSYADFGTYDVTLVVYAGSAICADTVTKPVTVYELPTVTISSDDPFICNPDCVNFTDASSGPHDIVTWAWDFGSGSVSANKNPQACFQHQSDYTEYYDVTLTVTDTEGCTNTDTFEDYVGVEQTPEALFTFSPDVLTVEDPRTQFTNLSQNAVTYEWNFNDDTPINTEFEPEHSFPNDDPGQYMVRLDAYSPSGMCHDYFLQLVVVEDILLFHVPNVFTPDGDDYNETFKPIFFSGYDPQDYTLTIFNRWGEVVFVSHNADYGWAGDYGNKGLVEDGTYVWSLEFGETMSDKKHKHKGHVTILK